ncbi:SURF1 family protein [Hirschia litorea]|uniref:SURF1-like protein n=1 Tax=Hirschia litorea TaxID=1199156 RepID=A0ABW2IIW9_9PROT
MTFRPFPILTIFSSVVLALLIWLGVWQWQRAEWKSGLIADYIAQAERGETDLATALCPPSENPMGKRVLPSSAVSTEWLRVFGQSTDGRPGWRVFTAIAAPPCVEGALLAETAFENYDGDVELIDTLRIVAMTQNRTSFSNTNAPEKNEWYWFDADAMEQSLFINGANVLNREYMLLASNGMPIHLTQTPPERHIGYSVTWFGMAIALIVLYGAFHIRAGRLRFSN